MPYGIHTRGSPYGRPHTVDSDALGGYSKTRKYVDGCLVNGKTPKQNTPAAAGEVPNLASFCRREETPKQKHSDSRPLT